MTHRIYYGGALPVILSPANRTTFPIGTIVPLIGAPGSNEAGTGVIPEWWLDRGTAGAVLMGTGTPITYPVPYGPPLEGIPGASHQVTYRITDSFGNVGESSIYLVMDNPPTMAMTPGEGSFVLLGQPATFSASGTEAGRK